MQELMQNPSGISSSKPPKDHHDLESVAMIRAMYSDQGKLIGREQTIFVYIKKKIDFFCFFRAGKGKIEKISSSS